ncbi:hypothetical protein HELRODRAFT_167699 [Helobdella robusta]|uniref:Uncharacterized protein n=1 Tax=Helobdella robusta TaxID=6412 RepID=T1EZP5_HELRO|nr:hypothetical protein HELRODRAFT_167699 [Helobdella robusta]ESO09882.1 hypothetical protein HELRODRAFT_167699 [Helobdella robusta]
MSEALQINQHVNNESSSDRYVNQTQNKEVNFNETENYANYASAAAAAAVQMQYMHQQQIMMGPGNYFPFVMTPAYQMIIQQQQQQQHRYLKNCYSHHQHDKINNDSQEGSPLNLQTPKERQIHNLHPVANHYNNQEATNYVSNALPAISNNQQFQHNNSFLNFNPNVMSSPHRFSNDLNNLVQNRSSFSSDNVKPDVPPPPKRPLTPYMRFSKCVSLFYMKIFCIFSTINPYKSAKIHLFYC